MTLNKLKNGPHTSASRIFVRRFVRRMIKSAHWLEDSLVAAVNVIIQLLDDLFGQKLITVPHVFIGWFVPRGRPPLAAVVSSLVSFMTDDNKIEPCSLTFRDLN